MGYVADASTFTLKGADTARIARSNEGWLVVWSRWRAGYAGSIVTGDFFALDGSHQRTVELATNDIYGNPNYIIPFDVAATPEGFQVVWSVPSDGISLQELDATGQPTSPPQLLHDRSVNMLHFASIPDASWLVYGDGGDALISPLPIENSDDYVLAQYWSQLQAVGGAAVWVWTRDDASFTVGRLGVAAPHGKLVESNFTFPTYGSVEGFALSKAKGNQALLASSATLKPFGVPRPRIMVGLVTITDQVGAEGGAGGAASETQGGAPGPGDTGGAPVGANEAGGVAGADSVSSTGDAGEAGLVMASSGASADVGGSPHSKPRTSTACGCRVVGEAESGAQLLWFITLGLTLARRRRPGWLPLPAAPQRSGCN